MRKKTGKITKIAAVMLSAALAVGQSAGSVMANPHYDRRDTVAEEEFVPAAGASDTENTESKVSSKAWRKINGVCYNGSGEKIPGAITRGIDVSEWQGNINWSKIKS